MTTVLPTPAPPNRPILPPLGYGASRSTTLMPVSSSSAEVACSTNAGAARWIGALSVVWIGPRSSTGSPITFMMRPRVPLPTGTRMPSPVFITDWPRVRPSVESMAMQRTVFSPRCWATSTTRLFSRSSMFALVSRSAV